MDHSEIAPLAKRLAEENNVDWRRLNGTGHGGQVVERDVLEYLARVMAGDEAVDPTPEPVPEGMAAWPEADVRAGADAQAEVDPTSTIEDDIFIFDDASSDDAPRGVVSDTREPAPLWTDDEALVDTSVPSTTTQRFDLDDDDAEGLLDVADDEEDHDVDVDDAPTAFGDEPWPRHGGELGDAFGAGADEDAAIDAQRSRGSLALGPELELDGDDAAAGPTLEQGGMRELPDLFMDDAVAAQGDADAASTDDDTPVFGDEAAVAPSVAPSGDAAVAVPPVAEPVEPAANLTALPLMRYPHVWRRQIDLSALVAAQADLAAEIGRDEPIALQAFLVRAASKALVGASWGGAIAVARVAAEGVRVCQVDAAGDFADTVAALDVALAPSASDEAGGATSDGVALVIADLSDYGVDDAALELDAPVLTLGRVLIDNQSGARRASLALSGEAAKGLDAARLLARVADLLERPVRLVV